MLRRFGVFLLMIAGLGCVLPMAAVEESAALDARTAWNVRTVIGAVFARSPATESVWINVLAGDVLAADTEIATGPDGSVVLASGRDIVTVQPDSRIELPGPGGPGGLLRVIERIGVISVLVSGRPGRTFTVETPYLFAAVKGTAFEVVVDGSGARVSVTEGSVEVSRGGGERAMVEPGQIASVRSGGGPISVAASSPSPGQDAAATSAGVGRAVPAADDAAAPEGTANEPTPAGATSGLDVKPGAAAPGASAGGSSAASGAAGGAVGAAGGAVGAAAGAAGEAAGGAAGAAAGAAGGAAHGPAHGAAHGAVGAAGGAAGAAGGAVGGALGPAGKAAGGAVGAVGGALGL